MTRVYDSAHNGNGFVGWDPDEGEENGREGRHGEGIKEKGYEGTMARHQID